MENQMTENQNGPDALADVAEERRRQIEQEHCTPQHDDTVNCYRELARAAVCYVDHYIGRSWLLSDSDEPNGAKKYASEELPDAWPDSWDSSAWKPKNPRRDLVRAAALLIAEIDRIDRAAMKRSK